MPVLLTSEQKGSSVHFIKFKDARGPWPLCESMHGEPKVMERLHPPLQMGNYADPMSTRGVSSPSPVDTTHTDSGFEVLRHTSRCNWDAASIYCARDKDRIQASGPLSNNRADSGAPTHSQELWVVKWKTVLARWLSKIRVPVGSTSEGTSAGGVSNMWMWHRRHKWTLRRHSGIGKEDPAGVSPAELSIALLNVDSARHRSERRPGEQRRQ